MFKVFTILFYFAATIAFGQVDSTTFGYQKTKLKKNQIKALYGYYGQEGNHSAVTGGQGTEELKVQSARIVYVKKMPKNNKWLIKTGLDNISSASTDNIDFVESSASKHDYRIQLNVGLNHSNKKDSLSYGANLSSSLESDYFSRGIGANLKKLNKFGGVSSLNANFFWDELRWGIITAEIFDFTKMVYPVELRDTNWFDISHRNTFTLSGKHGFVTSKRSRAGLMVDATYQTGVLSTPFHRVYDSFGTLRVEKLPLSRLKIPIAFQFNYFFGGGLLLKSYMRYSWDSFNINSYTYRLQTPIKLNYWIWIKPFVRFYYQNSANYFRPFKEHDFRFEKFYTSDYDLSQFWSFNYGLGLKFKNKSTWDNLNAVEFLLENYSREDGLHFWQTSFLVDFSF